MLTPIKILFASFPKRGPFWKETICSKWSTSFFQKWLGIQESKQICLPCKKLQKNLSTVSSPLKTKFLFLLKNLPSEYLLESPHISWNIHKIGFGTKNNNKLRFWYKNNNNKLSLQRSHSGSMWSDINGNLELGSTVFICTFSNNYVFFFFFSFLKFRTTLRQEFYSEPEVQKLPLWCPSVQPPF